MMGGPRGLLEQEVSKPRSVGRTLGRLGGYFRPFWFALVGVLLLMIVNAWVQVVTPELLGQAVDCYLTPATVGATASAISADMTAQGIADSMETLLAEIRRSGIEVSLGGEIEEGVSANEAIGKLLPLCLAAMFVLFVWQFESIRKSMIVMASIPFVSIGAALALKLSGTTLTFVGTLGLLALGGIIVNNAILLIDAIEEARATGVPPLQAVEEAAAKRLRPIVMTKMVCILGLVPLLLFGGTVWTSLSVVMIGGLALGTLITLGLIPALYAAFYRLNPAEA